MTSALLGFGVAGAERQVGTRRSAASWDSFGSRTVSGTSFASSV